MTVKSYTLTEVVAAIRGGLLSRMPGSTLIAWLFLYIGTTIQPCSGQAAGREHRLLEPLDIILEHFGDQSAQVVGNADCESPSYCTLSQASAPEIFIVFDPGTLPVADQKRLILECHESEKTPCHVHVAGFILHTTDPFALVPRSIWWLK